MRGLPRRSSRFRALFVGSAALLAGAAFTFGASASWATSAPAVTPTCTIFWTGAVDAEWATVGNWSASNGGPSSGTTPSASDVVCMSSTPVTAAVTLAGSVSASSLQWAATKKTTPTLTLSGTLTLTSATVASSLANLDLEGVLNPAGTFTVLGSATLGTTPTNTTSTLEGNGMLVTAGTSSLLGTFSMQPQALWHNTGSVTMDGEVEDFDTGGLTNEPGGLITAAMGDFAGAFTNQGTLVANGHLGIQDGVIGGAVAIAAGATVDAEESSFDGAVTGAGTLDLTGFDTIGGSAITAPVVLTNDIHLNGDVQLDSLTMDGGLLIGGTLTVTGPSTILNGCIGQATLVTQGPSTVDDLFVPQGSEWENEGTLTAEPDAQVTGGCPSAQGYGGNGLIVNEAGASITYADTTAGDVGTISAPLTNNGSLTVASGVLSTPSLTNDSGGTLSGGNYQLTGGTLVVGGAISTLHAELNIGATGQLSTSEASALKVLSSVQGRFTFHSSFQTINALDNSGSIDLAPDAQNDSPTLIAPAYTQAATGDLRVVIQRPNPLGAAFGHVSIAGAAVVGGTLTVATDGYRPKIGTTYDILTAAALTGRFATVIGGQPSGVTFSVAYTPTSVVLTVVK